ncbi:MAG: thioredoxin-disulfide reductase [Victivallaceae bacterium]|nr:thioredoxin-disulfide reductase [Victivallaceae bacterium]MDD4181658.1 thioredoxin-disulfide reductase [Victivallaceae bacterium]
MEDLVIIGNGPAGLTAAIYAARANLKPVLLAGPVPGGLLTQTTEVENFPGFPDPIQGVDLILKCQEQAERFGAKILYDIVEKAELKEGGPHKLTFTSGKSIKAKAVIIATGSSPRWLGLESEDRLKNSGVSACATCDGAFFRDMPVVVVGGGDTAMEEALFLTKFTDSVTVIHRRDSLRASKIVADRAMKHPKIKFMWDSVVEEILGDEKVEGVRVKNLKDEKVSKIACNGFFAALGHDPNTELFKGQIKMDKTGYIELSGQSSYTNMKGVFVAGDCADNVYRQAITAAGMGCRAAMDAERWLAESE